MIGGPVPSYNITSTCLLQVEEKSANHRPSLISVKRSLHKDCRQVPYLPTSLKHDPFITQTSSYSKPPFFCKTESVLQTSSHSQISSCVLPKDTSNTFQPTHLNYPRPQLQVVTPLTHFASFVSKLCRLSSTARFKLFQNKPSIGEASLDLRQAQQKLKTPLKVATLSSSKSTETGISWTSISLSRNG